MTMFLFVAGASVSWFIGFCMGAVLSRTAVEREMSDMKAAASAYAQRQFEAGRAAAFGEAYERAEREIQSRIALARYMDEGGPV